MPQQRVVPMLSYEDVDAAADWLVDAFGFEEVERFDWEGRVAHVTLKLGEGVVFLGSPSAEYKSPKTLAGATLLGELEEDADLGERRYRAADLEGHRWMFVQGS